MHIFMNFKFFLNLLTPRKQRRNQGTAGIYLNQKNEQLTLCKFMRVEFYLFLTVVKVQKWFQFGSSDDAERRAFPKLYKILQFNLALPIYLNRCIASNKMKFWIGLNNPIFHLKVVRLSGRQIVYNSTRYSIDFSIV